ncbi:muts domain V-domain-containing protein [Chytridium lagenaria]|nr:muts domain V-domain-containing protein [Chytridium lagenaria]
MYHGMDDLLSLAAREVVHTVPPKYARTLNVIYFPQLGYLITLPFDDNMEEESDFEIPGLFYQFCTESSVFFKSEEMYEMDRTIGDIHSMIVDKEMEIVQRLKDTVLTFSGFLTKVVQVCSELDCILSLTEAARQMDYRRPEGRHPLQELSVDVFVANNVELGIGSRGELNEEGENKRIILLTGPNASGKSVYLKQIGLIVFMAHIGSFVPADSATIGITDCILTRIQTGESVSKMQSAFMIDTQQISHALNTSTPISYEYGKGTSVADGMGLFCAVINHFTERAEESPFVIATTHFHEIMQLNLLNPSNVLLECRMDIVETDDSQKDFSKPVTFLYKARPGRALKSLGLHCGKLAGIPDRVLTRAKELTDLIANGKPITFRLLDNEVEQSQAAEQIMEKFMEFDCEKGDLAELMVFLSPFKSMF